jgi:hypothetical protein
VFGWSIQIQGHLFLDARQVEMVKAKPGDDSYEECPWRSDLQRIGPQPAEQPFLEDVIGVRWIPQHAPGNAEQ